jgi:hypothetical protein
LLTVTPVLRQEGSMITRITRGVLDVDREAEVFESLREGAASRPQMPGLIGFSLSRMLRDRAVVLVSISYWTDIDTMAAALGPGWQQPSWPGLNEHLTGATVEILETVATSFEEVEQLTLRDDSA